jgi:opacity protein-like surface antigen
VHKLLDRSQSHLSIHTSCIKYWSDSLEPILNFSLQATSAPFIHLYLLIKTVPYKNTIRFVSQLLLGFIPILISIGNAVASELPNISTKISLSDLTLDRSELPQSNAIAQTGLENSQTKRNDLGLGIQFGNSTSFGIDGKIGVAENFSLRPSVYFGSQPGAENKTVPPNSTFNPTSFEYKAGRTTNSNTGTSFGLAATYDFKLDSEGKTVAYIGPKVSFTNSSGPATVDGTKQPNIPSNKIDVSETKISLIAGADIAVTNDFTLGANVGYNFSRNVNVSVPALQGIVSTGELFQPSGSFLDFGIRAAYRF